MSLTNAIAIGQGAVNTASNQIVIGSTSQSVVCPNNITVLGNMSTVNFVLPTAGNSANVGYGIFDTNNQVGASFSGGTNDGINGGAQIAVLRAGTAIPLITCQSTTASTGTVLISGQLQAAQGMQCVKNASNLNFDKNKPNEFFSDYNFAPSWNDTEKALHAVVNGSDLGALQIASASDYRIKENFKQASPILDRLCSVPMFDYEFKNIDSIKKRGNHVGFFAHVLQETFPEYPNFIKGKKDQVNEDGSILPQHITSEFPVLLMKAIQEQNDIVKQLQQEMHALKLKVKAKLEA